MAGGCFKQNCQGCQNGFGQGSHDHFECHLNTNDDYEMIKAFDAQWPHCCNLGDCM